MQPLEWNHAQTKDSYLANLGSWLSNFGDIPPIRHVDNDESENVNWTVTHCQGKWRLLPIFGRRKAYFHCTSRGRLTPKFLRCPHVTYSTSTGLRPKQGQINTPALKTYTFCQPSSILLHPIRILPFTVEKNFH